MKVAALGAIAAGAVAVTFGGILTSSGDGTPVDSDPVPAVHRCAPDALSVSLGQAGAWHEQATQLIEIVNRSAARCSVPSRITVTAVVPSGADTRFRDDAGPEQPVVLGPWQAAMLLVGAPGGCSGSVIAKRLEVTVGDGPVVTLGGAWVPLSCGHPAVLLMQRQPA